MTPLSNQFELRAAELIQRATIARRVYIARRPHALDSIRINTDGYTVDITPYNGTTKPYINNLVAQAEELNYTTRIVQLQHGGCLTYGIKFTPQEIPATANCFPTIYTDSALRYIKK